MLSWKAYAHSFSSLKLKPLFHHLGLLSARSLFLGLCKGMGRPSCMLVLQWIREAVKFNYISSGDGECHSYLRNHSSRIVSIKFRRIQPCILNPLESHVHVPEKYGFKIAMLSLWTNTNQMLLASYHNTVYLLKTNQLEFGWGLHTIH